MTKSNPNRGYTDVDNCVDLKDPHPKALDFYTNVLGFIKKNDVPLGEHRWLTVVSSQEQDGVELLLEPIAFEPTKTYQKSLKEAGIPWTAFEVQDLDSEFERLTKLGVEFFITPKEAGTVKIAVLDDTCGNYIQLMQIMTEV
ncbi:VOC family protein [Parashewanella curva]|uniref:VOC family protein n=1 Tax=Parashewanella curva TaxID=2338552 RepID=A0A3L8PQS0_9GAMM|nr:VOC family protein [Parashewanella curva]